MNTFTDHDRKLAATLRELSASPAPSPGVASSAPKERTQQRGRIFLAGAVMLLIGAAVVSGPGVVRNISDSLSAPAGQTPAESTPSRPQQTAPAAVIQPIHSEITGSGYVVAPQMATVYAERGGRITAIHIQPGDVVAAGDPLLTMDETGIRFAAEEAQLIAASADLSFAAALISLGQAETVLNRQTALNQRGVVASERLEDAKTVFLRAANAVEQAKANQDKANLALRIAEERVAELTVRAPIAGTVAQLSAHVGDAVLDRVDAIHDGIGLMTIARMDRLAIDADVAEKAIAELRQGLAGKAVLDAFPDQPFSFEVHNIAPKVNAARGTVELRLAPVDPPQGMRPGMAARIRIVLPNPDSPSTNHSGELSQ